MRTVLVTGVAGFLGSHLAKHHLDQGDEVVGIDNFCSSSPGSQHFQDLNKRKNFTFLHRDICAFLFDHIGEFCFNMPDVIYNFACPASPPIYQEMPVLTMQTCVVGTMNMLELASKTGAVLVHASTSEVYGDPTVSPQQESYRGYVNSYGPRACYDEGKRAAEALCYDYLNMYQTDARLVRIFNTYGPHMDPNDGRVVSNFICQTLKGKPLTIYGSGEQSRSFCYVDDLVRAVVTLGRLDKNPRGPINVGNPFEFTINELAKLVVEKVPGTDLKLVQQALPVDDPTQRRPDITRAKEFLGWEPRVQLSEGLDRSIEYFRNVLK